DRLSGGLRHALDAVELQIDGIDVGNGAAQALLVLEARAQLGDALRVGRRLRLGRCQLLLEALDLRLARTPERHAPPQALAHGARAVEAGRRAVAAEAGADGARRLEVLELHLDQVGQLEVVEEEIEELLLGEGEGKIVLALAVGAALAAAAARAALRLGNLVADLVLLVAGQHVVAHARVAAEAEGGLAQALGADGDLLGALGLGDLARAQRVLDGLADLRLCAAQEALAVAEALGLGVEAAVDDLHELLPASVRQIEVRFPARPRAIKRTSRSSHSWVFAIPRAMTPMAARVASRRSWSACSIWEHAPHVAVSSTSSPACTIRPGGGPGARYSRARPCAARTPRASSRFRCPASCRS